MKNFRAKKIPLETVIHGEKRVDYYDWMRLTDKQKNSKIKDSNTKEVLEYIKVESIVSVKIHSIAPNSSFNIVLFLSPDSILI